MSGLIIALTSPIPEAGCLGYKDMGHYTLTNSESVATRADYTFAYHKLSGRVLISLHHSSLTWVPPDEASSGRAYYSKFGNVRTAVANASGASFGRL